MCNSSICTVCDKHLFYLSLSTVSQPSADKTQCSETIRGTPLIFNTGIHRTNTDRLTNWSSWFCLNTGRKSQYASAVNLPQNTRGSCRISIHMLLRGTETREDVNRGRTSSRCQTQCQEGVQKTRSVQKISFFILLKVLMASNQLVCYYIISVIHIQQSNIVICHLSRFKINLIKEHKHGWANVQSWKRSSNIIFVEQ